MFISFCCSHEGRSFGADLDVCSLESNEKRITEKEHMNECFSFNEFKNVSI